jgi:hypothetical protein
MWWAIAPHLVFEAFMASTVPEQASARPQICPAIRIFLTRLAIARPLHPWAGSAGFLAWNFIGVVAAARGKEQALVASRVLGVP